jgi:hypothetical protein
MPKVIRRVLAAAVLTLLAGVGTASAATLYQVNPSTPFGDNGNAVVRIEYSTYNYDEYVRAGGFDLSTTAVATPASSFVAWCLDIVHDLTLPSQYKTTTTPFSSTTGAIDQFRLDNILKLFNVAYSALNLGSASQSAGFQLALWELLYEKPSNGYSLNDGRFEANSTDARTFANTLLGQLGQAATGAFQLIFYESSDKVWTRDGWVQKSQNLVGIAPVPLPAAGLMLGAGLVGLFALKRSKRRDVASA